MLSYQLTVVEGEHKGRTWSVGDRKILIGRDNACDVVVDDPLVSRKHCELLFQEDALHLRDLDSSNATLVNGMPVAQRVLEQGDRVSVGDTIFLVTCSAATPPSDAPPTLPQPTLKLFEAQARLWDEARIIQGDGGPQTIRDLAFLLHLTHAAAGCATIPELLETLETAIQERFKPKALWLCMADPATGAFVPRSGGQEAEVAAQFPEGLLDQVVAQRQGMLLPEKRRQQGRWCVQLLLAAPIVWHDQVTGVIALQGLVPKTLYDEQDLELLIAVARGVAPYFHAIEQLEVLARENERLRRDHRMAAGFVGQAPAVRKIRASIAQFAKTAMPVLITGETGTGKELLAHLLHDLSPRADKGLVIVNCAAIPTELFESEFFGHEKGAFSGAVARKQGLLELSNGGTLFLDEIAELSADNQARILRAIENGIFRRVGGVKDIKVDVRYVAATNRSLAEAMRAGTFRDDLYYRLVGLEVRVPPLRERREDIPLLAQHLLEAAAVRFKREVHRFSPDALQALVAREWPGNVRELKHVIDVSVQFAHGPVIDLTTLENLPLAGKHSSEPLPLTMAEMEARHLHTALAYCDGNVKKTANLLGIGRTTLYEKMDKYGLKQGNTPQDALKPE